MTVYGSYFCTWRQQEVQEERLPAARRPEHDRVGDVLVVQVEVERRPVRRFEDGQVLAPEVGVGGRSAVEREQERQVGVVGVEQVQVAEIGGAATGDRGQPGVQEVRALLHQRGVVRGEHLETLGDAARQGCPVLVPQHHTEGTLAEEPAVEFDLAETGAEVRDEGGGPLVNQHVLRWGGRRVEVVGETRLGVVEVPTLGLDRAADGAGLLPVPFAHRDEVGRHFVETLQEVGVRPTGRVLEREHLHVVVIQAQEATVALERRVGDLGVEERVTREASQSGLPGPVVEEAPEEAEGLGLVQHARRDRVLELHDEGLDLGQQLLAGPGQVVIDQGQRAIRGQPIGQRG